MVIFETAKRADSSSTDAVPVSSSMSMIPCLRPFSFMRRSPVAAF